MKRLDVLWLAFMLAALGAFAVMAWLIRHPDQFDEPTPTPTIHVVVLATPTALPTRTPAPVVPELLIQTPTTRVPTETQTPEPTSTPEPTHTPAGTRVPVQKGMIDAVHGV